MRSSKKEKRKRVKKRYVLDTSAIISYFANEDGASKVAQILEASLRREGVEVFLSFMTLMELEYNYLKKSGEELAKEVLLRLETLPLEISFENSSSFIHHVTKIKVESTLSVADAWIVALALERKATLVHKDPEFESVSKIVTQLFLPYKK